MGQRSCVATQFLLINLFFLVLLSTTWYNDAMVKHLILLAHMHNYGKQESTVRDGYWYTMHSTYFTSLRGVNVKCRMV